MDAGSRSRPAGRWRGTAADVKGEAAGVVAGNALTGPTPSAEDEGSKPLRHSGSMTGCS